MVSRCVLWSSQSHRGPRLRPREVWGPVQGHTASQQLECPGQDHRVGGSQGGGPVWGRCVGGQGRAGGPAYCIFSHLPRLPRSHLAEATALYSLVDEQLHVLVTASNHLLRRLGLRVRLGRLEAAIHQVRGGCPGTGVGAGVGRGSAPPVPAPATRFALVQRTPGGHLGIPDAHA